MRYLYIMQHEKLSMTEPYRSRKTVSEPICFQVSTDEPISRKTEAYLMAYFNKSVRQAAKQGLSSYLGDNFETISRKIEEMTGGSVDLVSPKDLLTGYNIHLIAPKDNPDTGIDDTGFECFNRDCPDGLAIRLVLRKKIHAMQDTTVYTKVAWRDRDGWTSAISTQYTNNKDFHKKQYIHAAKVSGNELVDAKDIEVLPMECYTAWKNEHRTYIPDASGILPGLAVWNGEDTWNKLLMLYSETFDKISPERE